MLNTTSLGIQSKIKQTVAQHHLFALSIACFKEKRGAVQCHHGQLLILLLLSLDSFFNFLRLCNTILASYFSHLSNLLGRGFAVPVEAEKHHNNQHNANNCVLIHMFVLYFVAKRGQRYKEATENANNYSPSDRKIISWDV